MVYVMLGLILLGGGINLLKSGDEPTLWYIKLGVRLMVIVNHTHRS